MESPRKRRVIVNIVVLIAGLALFSFLIKEAWSSWRTPQQPDQPALNSQPAAANSSEKPAGPVAQIIKADEVHKILARREKGVTILDIQERKKFKAEHLAGAINIPTDELEARAEDELSKSDMIIVVDCACDGTNTAALMINTYLLNLGYSKVVVMDEGLNAWRARSYDLVVENK